MVNSVVNTCTVCAKPGVQSSAWQIITINNNKYIIQPCKINVQESKIKGKENAKKPLIFKERLRRCGQHILIG